MALSIKLALFDYDFPFTCYRNRLERRFSECQQMKSSAEPDFLIMKLRYSGIRNLLDYKH